MSAPAPQSFRFTLRTYGCQMNVHDSEKVANLLHHAGHEVVSDEERADLLVINTCSIRDKAEHQLYSDLGLLRLWKLERPGRLLGVGGCVAQQVGDGILRRFPHVDFVFGPQNVHLVPAMVGAAEAGRRALEVDETRGDDRFSRFDLPDRHPSLRPGTPGRAFVTAMEGCDMFCTFCIVPLTRGREVSRPVDQIVREVVQLADQGVREITLLGQTVNAYGRHDARRGQAGAADTVPFARLLERLDRLPGIDRIRYTSPHPLFFDGDLIRAHGALESLCPHVHLPVQSGSDSVLKAMRRRYSRTRYLEIVAGLRAARPDIAITTDLIVGFPGETDADFEATLDLVREARFVDSFSFKHSPRPGTAAVDLPEEEVPGDVAQARLEALQTLQRDLTLAYHRSRVGGRTPIVIDGPSRRGRRGAGAGGQLCGRDPYHRVVNLIPPAGSALGPGDRIEVEIAAATPHSLIGEITGVSDGPAAHHSDALRVLGQPPAPRSTRVP